MKIKNNTNIDNDFLKILKEAKALSFNEIIIEENVGIFFNKFEKGKLISISYDYKGGKVDRNLILKYFKKLTYMNYEEEKERYVEVFLYEDKKNNEKIFFRFYLFHNGTNLSIIIKLFSDNENYLIDSYFKNIEDKKYKNNKEKILNLYNEIISPRSNGLYIIGANSTYIKKNFFYSIIKKINSLENKYKIIIYEQMIEQIFEKNKSFIFQSQIDLKEDIQNFSKKILSDIDFVNPDVVFLETEFLNKEILYLVLRITQINKKVFVITNTINFELIKYFVEKTLLENNYTFDYFLSNFKKFILLNSKNKKNVIEKIYSVEDINL